MEGHFSTGQSPQWALVPMEEEEEEEEEEEGTKEEDRQVAVFNPVPCDVYRKRSRSLHFRKADIRFLRL